MINTPTPFREPLWFTTCLLPLSPGQGAGGREVIPCGRTKVVLCLPVGGGRAGRPGKHMPGQSRSLSARAFQYLVNASPGLEEGRETARWAEQARSREERGGRGKQGGERKGSRGRRPRGEGEGSIFCSVVKSEHLDFLTLTHRCKCHSVN